MAANTLAEQILATQASNLKGYWKCDDDGTGAPVNLVDSSGLGQTLTQTLLDTADYRADGPAGYAIGPLDGTAEYAVATASPLSSTLPNAFTLFVVFKMVNTTGTAARALFGLGSSTDLSTAYLGVYNNAGVGKVGLRIRDAGTDRTTTPDFGVGSAITAGIWYTAAIVFSSSNTYKVYIDGVQTGSDQTLAATLDSNPVINLDRVTIAASDRAGAIEWANATIQHAAMWNVALSGTEITALQNAMPVMKIKPAGGGDFTTISAWAAVVDTTGGTRKAECYAGACGGWTATSAWTPTVTEIYAEAGAKHTGRDTGTSGIARISSAVSLTGMLGANTVRIKDMRIEAAVTLNQNSTATGFTLEIDRNMWVISSGVITSLLGVTSDPSSGTISTTFKARNNVFYVTGGTITNVILCDAIAGATETSTIADTIATNTVSITGGTISYGIRRRASAAATGNSQCSGAVTDCIVFGTTSAGNLYRELAGSGGSESVANTSGYNAVTDATGSVFGATGSLSSQTAANWLTNTASDASLKSGSPGINAGNTVAGFSDDVIGTTRPQGAAWDIGAFEMTGGRGGLIGILGESVF